jgi:hypothetical protein
VIIKQPLDFGVLSFQINPGIGQKLGNVGVPWMNGAFQGWGTAKTIAFPTKK